MTKKNGYLYSCVVIAHYQGHEFVLRIVFVSKRGSKKDYLVLATTQYKLTRKLFSFTVADGKLKLTLRLLNSF